MDSIYSSKRPCFLEEDEGLAFLADMEAGYSGQNHYHHHGLISRFMGGYAVSNFRIGGGSRRFYDARYEDRQPYFLEACFLCRKPLGDNKDIFMYRGDTPFCSEECREEQIEMDKEKEKNRNLSSSMKAMRNKEQTESTSPSNTQNYSCVRGTIAAA